MGEETKRESAFYFIRSVVITDVVILVFVAVVLWIGDWFSAWNYGTGLMLAGMGIILLGVMSLMGSYRGTRTFDYQQSRMAGENYARELEKQDTKDIRGEYGFLFLAMAAGGISIVIGLLVRTFA